MAAGDNIAYHDRAPEPRAPRAHELENALVRLTGEHDTLIDRARALVERESEDVERQIVAFQTAIAATQASIFWRLERRLARLLRRARRGKARG